MSVRRHGTALRCVALTPGLVLAPLVMPVSAVVVLLVLATLMAGLTLVLVSDELPEGSDPHARAAAVREAVAPAPVGGLATVSLAALATVSLVLALLVLVAVVLCSPGLLDALRARTHVGPLRTPEPAASTPDRAAPVVPGQRAGTHDADHVGSMSSSRLRRAWRESYEVLQGPTTPRERLALAEWRRACLDELESRDPVALAAWLDSGATASRGPDAFLTPDP